MPELACTRGIAFCTRVIRTGLCSGLGLVIACSSPAPYTGPDLPGEAIAQVRVKAEVPEYFLDSMYWLSVLFQVTTGLGGNYASAFVDVYASPSLECERAGDLPLKGSIELTSRDPEADLQVPAMGCVRIQFRYSERDYEKLTSCTAGMAFTPRTTAAYLVELIRDPIQCDAELRDATTGEKVEPFRSKPQP